jgi:hypothetical protein
MKATDRTDLFNSLTLYPGKYVVPLYKGLGDLQVGSRRVRKISTQLGFDPWSVQPVTSRYPGPRSKSIALEYLECIWKITFKKGTCKRNKQRPSV